MSFYVTKQVEKAPELSVDLARVQKRTYGRYLNEFVPGQVFVHPRGYTFERSEIRAFATAFMQANPIYLNLEVARAHGFEAIPASPQMVFNIALSLGVQNDSEKAMANLGYYDARFLRPVYAGDTIRALTRVESRRERGADKPGIVHVQTMALNQRDQAVLTYDRKIMIPYAPGWTPDARANEVLSESAADFPWPENSPYDLAFKTPSTSAQVLTQSDTYFEDFQPGDIIVHANGRSITDEHVGWTYRVANTHPLHYDRVYSQGLSGPMSGEPIVYGGLVFAWLEGLASRDLSENALWELGFTEGYHTQPAITGDTVAAISRVLSCDPAPDAIGTPAGIVTTQLIGVKNISAAAALDTYGADLFIKEGAKKRLGKEKIAAKIFEIERRLLVKSRAG